MIGLRKLVLMAEPTPMTTPHRLAVPGEGWILLFRIAGRFVMAVGVLPLILGLWNIVAIAWFASSAQRAGATVTTIGPPNAGGLRLYYACRYDVNRGTVEVAWYNMQRGKWSISVGKKVPILYQSHNPEQARLEVPQPYFAPGLCVVVGLLFVSGGWLFSRFPTLFKPYAKSPVKGRTRR